MEKKMVDALISWCSKLVQKEYKTRYKRVGKGIYRELFKRFKFYRTAKRYMLKTESFLDNETHKILGDFDIKTDP